jgi:hypothetical protein
MQGFSECRTRAEAWRLQYLYIMLFVWLRAASHTTGFHNPMAVHGCVLMDWEGCMRWASMVYNKVNANTYEAPAIEVTSAVPL